MRKLSLKLQTLALLSILFIILFSGGCAERKVLTSLSRERGIPSYASKGVQEIGRFCSRHNLKYSFNTLDDIVRISSGNLDIKLLLSSTFFYVNGRILSLGRPPFYRNGKIFIPLELERIIVSPPEKISVPSTLVVQTVVIDPGHGGKDPGAVSRWGLKEKDVNLRIAKYLKKELERRGFKVYLTRDRDVYLTLRQRVNFAKRHRADMFISIHVNANRSRRVKGFEVYYLSDRYFDSESKALVMAENASLGFSEKSFPKDTRRIVWDLICSENNAFSLEFANTVVSTFKSMGFYTRPPKGAPFYVLKYAYVPSVLVEVGYLTNRYEERLLRKSYYLKQIARGLALSVSRINRCYARLTSND